MGKITQINCPTCGRRLDITPIDSLTRSKNCHCGAVSHPNQSNIEIFEKYYPQGYPEKVPEYCGACEHFSQDSFLSPGKGICTFYGDELTLSGEGCILTKFVTAFGTLEEYHKCPNCSKEQNIMAEFCKDCGSEMHPKVFIKVAHCDKCKTNYPLDFTFCEIDGNKLKKTDVEEGNENYFHTNKNKSSKAKKTRSDTKKNKPPSAMRMVTEGIGDEVKEIAGIDVDKQTKEKLGFGWGNLWIGACIFQGIVLLIFTFYGLNQYLFDLGYAIIVLAVSGLAFASGFYYYRERYPVYI